MKHTKNLLAITVHQNRRAYSGGNDYYLSYPVLAVNDQHHFHDFMLTASIDKPSEKTAPGSVIGDELI